MTFDVLRWKYVSAIAVVVMVLGAWATSAQAQGQYSLSGNARFQIGNGLPIPIRTTPAPNGAVFVGGGFAAGGEVVVSQGSQTAGPRDLIMPEGMAQNPALALTANLNWANPAVFQVRTKVVATFPLGPVSTTKTKFTFKANGRNGYKTVSWCPGDGTITSTGNPACPAGPGGRVVYKRAGLQNQFGGAVPAVFSGTANVAINLPVWPNNLRATNCAGGTPGVCNVAFANASPVAGASPASPTFPNSRLGTFGDIGTSNGIPEAVGKFAVAVANMTINGHINVLGAPITTPVNGSAGVTNKATGWFAPWTTGQVRVSALSASPPEAFTITGSDMRDANGIGSISLVSGSISDRQATGANANRGWLNFTITALPQAPAMSPAGIVTLVSLMGLAGGYGMVRRRSGN